MFETAGALATLQPLLSLVALIAVPAFATFLIVALRRGQSRSLIASIIAISASFATFGLAIVFATRLALQPKGTVLAQHLFQLARLGQLDLAFDLALDPRAATFAVVVATIGGASTLHTVMSKRPGTGSALAWTWLAITGALVIVGGDGLAPIMVGLGLLSLGAWGNARGSDHGPSVVTLAGNVGVLVGLVFLFWSLGGSFGAEGYDPDGAPRFVLVTTSTPAPQQGKAALVMTTHAGALVSSDDSDLPEEPVTSPFALALDPGLYTLRVQGGVATGDVVVPRVQLVAGRTHVLAPAGPTVSLRVLEDQLVIPRVIPSGGVTTVRSLLTSRAIGGLRASAVVILLVIGSALAHAHAFAGRRGPGPMASVLSALPASYLALRLVPLIDPSTADNALVVLLGAGSAVALSARAACLDDAHQALRGVVASSTSIAVVAAGLGEPTAAMVIALASLAGGGAALGALEARRDVRWLGVAAAATVGLLPGAGASAGYALTLATALTSATTGSVGWAVFAGVVAIATTFALTFAALAAFRVYDVVLLGQARETSPIPLASPGQGVVVSVLSAIALGGGAALGVGTTAFGGSVAPLAQRLLGPMAAAGAPPREIAIVGVVLSLASVVAGVLLARRASATAAPPPRWLVLLGRPYAVVSFAGELVSRTGDLLHDGVTTMDRELIDDVPVALGAAMVRVGRACARLTTWASGKVNPRLERAAVAAEVKLDLDHPRSAERLRLAALFAMVAVLGLVVLSSLFLG